MYHGAVNVYKEKGYTSFDVVAVMRGIFSQKAAGHTGTLDPQAEGVLCVCLGSATKLSGMLTDTDKTYEAVMRLGVVTDTQDMTGRVLEEKSTEGIKREDLEAVLSGYTGRIAQIPPMYSAKKAGGRKLCDLARSGIEVERKPSIVNIYKTELVSYEEPLAKIIVSCSKGTYIRTLCHDVGRELGCGAAMESLLRTRTSGLCVKDSLTLDALKALKAEGRLDEAVIPTDRFFLEYPAAKVQPEKEKLLLNGNPLRRDALSPAPDLPEEMRKADADMFSDKGMIRMYSPSGKFKALYRYDADKDAFYPAKMFLED